MIEQPYTKLKKIFMFSLIILTTVLFSTIVVLAAQNIAVKARVSVNYSSTPATIKTSFYSYIPNDCTTIIFDYASEHPTIINDKTITQTTVDVKDRDYASNGITMFYDSANTTAYVLSNNTIFANESSSNMFYCKQLTSIQFNNFNTSNVTNMGSMFYGCFSLTSLDVTNFNTSKVTSMSYMFSGCSALTSLDLSSFNTSIVEDMRSMFDSCYKIKTIYVGDQWSTNSVTKGYFMFDSCVNLVGGSGTAYNSRYTGVTYARIDGGTASPGYFTRKTS